MRTIHWYILNSPCVCGKLKCTHPRQKKKKKGYTNRFGNWKNSSRESLVTHFSKVKNERCVRIAYGELLCVLFDFRRYHQETFWKNFFSSEKMFLIRKKFYLIFSSNLLFYLFFFCMSKHQCIFKEIIFFNFCYIFRSKYSNIYIYFSCLSI